MFLPNAPLMEFFTFSVVFMILFLLSIYGAMKVSRDPENNSEIMLFVFFIFTSITFFLSILAFLNLFLGPIGTPINLLIGRN